MSCVVTGGSEEEEDAKALAFCHDKTPRFDSRFPFSCEHSQIHTRTNRHPTSHPHRPRSPWSAIRRRDRPRAHALVVCARACERRLSGWLRCRAHLCLESSPATPELLPRPPYDIEGGFSTLNDAFNALLREVIPSAPRVRGPLVACASNYVEKRKKQHPSYLFLSPENFAS